MIHFIRTLLTTLCSHKCPNCSKRSSRPHPEFEYLECSSCNFTYFLKYESSEIIELTPEQVESIKQESIESEKNDEIIRNGMVPLEPDYSENPNVDVLHLNSSNEVIFNSKSIDFESIEQTEFSSYIVIELNGKFDFARYMDILLLLTKAQHKVSVVTL